MDDLSLRLLKLASDPNASMEDLIAGMESLTAAIDADNRRQRQVAKVNPTKRHK